MNAVLKKITQNKKMFKCNFSINYNKEIIIDFYNVYCNFINFEKYKTFTKDTFLNCLSKVMKSIKTDVHIVSKVIFEVEDKIIIEQTLKYKNLKYYIIEDDNEEKSLNRERDDFVCILLNYIHDKTSYIISNDKYTNYENIIKKVKPLTIKMFYNGKISKFKLTKDILENLKTELNDSKFIITRKSFSFS